MISDAVLIKTIVIGILIGCIAVGLQRVIFKKSIIFYIAAIVVVPIVVGCAMGLVLGARGIHHFWWAGFLVIAITTVGLELIAWILRRPLNQMIKTVDSLSKGNVDVSIDEKYQKGEHELAQVMRQLSELTNSLQNIAAFANSVGKGELNVEYTLLGENDILGKSMLDMRANLLKAEKEKEDRHKEDEQRNWVTQGVAKFAELLRVNHDNIEALCQSIVSNLVKYVGANQAGIFILNDENEQNKVLELKGCYAYERRKYLQKTIELGEGLVGTCFLERESIYLTDIPQDYLSITSGLGEEAPHALLITPLRVNEDVYGVVEIASFKLFEPHVKEFIQKVAESIASTIASVNVSLRTNRLLEQSKIQAEAMSNQEEELRQSMEEMRATQEEMYRKNEEIERANEELAKALEENQKKM